MVIHRFQREVVYCILFCINDNIAMATGDVGLFAGVLIAPLLRLYVPSSSVAIVFAISFNFSVTTFGKKTCENFTELYFTLNLHIF